MAVDKLMEVGEKAAEAGKKAADTGKKISETGKSAKNAADASKSANNAASKAKKNNIRKNDSDMNLTRNKSEQSQNKDPDAAVSDQMSNDAKKVGKTVKKVIVKTVKIVSSFVNPATAPFAWGAAIIFALILLVTMIVTCIKSSALSIYTPADEDSDYVAAEAENSSVTSPLSGYTIDEDTLDGDIMAQKLVKMYKKSYKKIDSENASRIEYLHDSSNLLDVMIVCATLQQTGWDDSVTAGRITDVHDDDESGSTSLWDKIKDGIKSSFSFIRNLVTQTDSRTQLYQTVYDEMFYYKVHWETDSDGVPYKVVNIYNKTADDYIEEHEELTDLQIDSMKLAMDEDYQIEAFDTTEYDKIAYRGYGSGSYYPYGGDGSNLYIDPTSAVSEGYASKSLPSGSERYRGHVRS